MVLHVLRWVLAQCGRQVHHAAWPPTVLQHLAQTRRILLSHHESVDSVQELLRRPNQDIVELGENLPQMLQVRPGQECLIDRRIEHPYRAPAIYEGADEVHRRTLADIIGSADMTMS